MSRKNFIVTALVVNFAICVTLCIVLFTGNVGDRQNSNHNESTVSNINNERPGNQAIVNIEDITETTDLIPGNNEETTAIIIESQVQTDTQPYNYREQTSDTALAHQNTGQGTQQGELPQDTWQTQTPQQSQETWQPQTTQKAKEEQTIAVNGTTAVITGSCNIRSNKNVGNNIIGSARAGETYRIEPSQCTANWIAIYVNASTLGYVSTAFCSIQ